MGIYCHFFYYNPDELQPLGLYRVLTALHLVCGATTTGLNVVILRAIWKTKSLHTPSMVLTFGLAISDVCMGALAQPLTMAYLLTMQIKGVHRLHCLSGILSQSIVTYLSGSFGLTLLAVSIDRLLAIKTKTKYKTLVTMKRAIISLVIIWGVCFAIIPILLIMDSLEVIFGTVLVVGLVILITVVVVNIEAFRSLRKISLEKKPDKKTETVQRKNVSSFKQTLWTILIILAVIMLLFLPYICNGIVYLNNPVSDSEVQNASYNIGVFILSLHSLANPIVYLWRMKKIRAAVRNSIKCCKKQENRVSGAAVAQPN